MNENIKHLIEQAGTDISGKWISLNNAEKFAELIVRKCADLADDHNSEVEGVTLGVGQALKQHFGIES